MAEEYTHMLGYVTYTEPDGILDGSFFQVPPVEHQSRLILVSDGVRDNWCAYKANTDRNGVELLPSSTPNIQLLKTIKNLQINRWREQANFSSFPYQGKDIACDALSRSDIDGVANHIALLGGFPEGFPNAWKAVDNTYILLPTIDDFKEMYAAMTSQGTANFAKAQQLKAALAEATTVEDIDAIVW